MECQSCRTVNAPGRRYCRECGSRLGRPCPACHFPNSLADLYCGGCGAGLEAVREHQAGGEKAAPAAEPVPPAPPPDEPAAGGINLEEIFEDQPSPVEAPPANATVSQSEIDDLFDKIHEDGGEPDGKR